MMRAIIYALLICGIMTLGLVTVYTYQSSNDSIASKTSDFPETGNVVKSREDSQGSEKKALITIKAQIKGVRNTHGKIIAQLYDKEEAFNNNRYGQAVSSITMLTKSFNGELCFSNIPPAEYAIVLFHDENNNQRFDQTMTLIEGYAYSNNTGKNAPAKFHQAAFGADSDTQQIINMIYY